MECNQHKLSDSTLSYKSVLLEGSWSGEGVLGVPADGSDPLTLGMLIVPARRTMIFWLVSNFAWLRSSGTLIFVILLDPPAPLVGEWLPSDDPRLALTCPFF